MYINLHLSFCVLVTIPPVSFDNYNITLGPGDYFASSLTRKCSKTHLGNTCRRDWLGKPEITCITTCDTDFCNCDTRSPPQKMFKLGKPLPIAPKDAIYFDKDLTSCKRGSDTVTTQIIKRKRKVKKYIISYSNVNICSKLYIISILSIHVIGLI